jgi:hypothetical protein
VKWGSNLPLFFVLNFEPLCDSLQKPPILDVICNYDEVILNYEFLESNKNSTTIPLGLGSLSFGHGLGSIVEFFQRY